MNYRGRGRGRVRGAASHMDVSSAMHGGGHTSAHRARSEASSDDRSYPGGARGPIGSRQELHSLLESLDGANYGALKQLTGQRFALEEEGSTVFGAVVSFLHIQSDPYAPGSQLCVTTSLPLTRADLVRVTHASVADSGLADELARQTARVAVEDFVLRCFAQSVKHEQDGHAIEIAHASQHVLQRDAVVLTVPPESAGTGARVEVSLYFRAKLPGHGRRIDGRGVARIVLNAIASAAVRLSQLSVPDLLLHTVSVLDQTWLRSQLAHCGLAAFVRNGAILPRVDGITDTPMPAQEAVCFQSPPSLQRTFALPYSGEGVTGMGLPTGLTLIAGGGYHGKSTLLKALELGVYSHIPGDGREFVVTDPTATKIRAEDRRYVDGVDISPFINHLPTRTVTTSFCTRSASGSTSQAAAVMEALELGCCTLLLDEDTCATNFMFRDALMAALVPDADEPITPFATHVRELVDVHGCSVVMVVGGSGQYFAMADHVLVMQAYRVLDKTTEAKAIASTQAATGLGRATTSPAAPHTSSVFSFPGKRDFHYAASFAEIARDQRDHSRAKMSASGPHRLRLGPDTFVDLSLVEQLVEEGQANALAQSIAFLYDLQRPDAVRDWLSHRAPPIAATHRPLSAFAQHVYACHGTVTGAGLHMKTPSCYVARGFSAAPRVFELGAALNRMRGLRTGPL